MVEKGERAGVTQMGSALDSQRAALTQGRWDARCAALIAEAYRRVGQALEGLDVVNKALAGGHQTECRYYEAELYRLKGELLLARPTIEAQEAEACFHNALTISRDQSAKSLELRAAMSMSRLWRNQGKRDEARELLGAIYGWFTEGFDTADLQAARTLLDEL